MEKLPYRRQRIELPHGLVAVDGQISQLLDHAGLRKNHIAHRCPESRLVDQRAQMLLIRQLQ